MRKRKRLSRVNDAFRRFATGSARGFGSAWMFIGAALLCIGWMLTGPMFRFSEAWQFFINDLTGCAGRKPSG
jgi:low affinity Fe/Cu permease